MPPTDSISFPCRPSPGKMFLYGLFFCACAAVLAWKAHTNHRGLIINGIVRLGEHGATAFYWVAAVLAALFVVAAGWILFTTLVFGIPDVVLSGESITFPVGFPVKRAFTLPFAEIGAISRQQVNGQRFLMLHAAGKKHCIVLNWLGSKHAAQTLEDELARRLGCAANAHAEPRADGS